MKNTTNTNFYATNMFKLAIAEMKNTLKNNNLPVNTLTQKAFVLGVQVSSNVYAEIATQMLMDIGTDEMALKAIEAQNPTTQTEPISVDESTEKQP